MKALGIVSITGESMGSYHIETDTNLGEDAMFSVINKDGNKIGRAWCTIEGATSCAELLAEGYWKE